MINYYFSCLNYEHPKIITWVLFFCNFGCYLAFNAQWHGLTLGLLLAVAFVLLSSLLFFTVNLDNLLRAFTLYFLYMWAAVPWSSNFSINEFSIVLNFTFLVCLIIFLTFFCVFLRGNPYFFYIFNNAILALLTIFMAISCLNGCPTVILSWLYGIAIFLALMVFSSRKPAKSSLFLFALLSSAIFSVFLLDEHLNWNCPLLYKHNFISIFSSLSSFITFLMCSLTADQSLQFKSNFHELYTFPLSFDLDLDYYLDSAQTLMTAEDSSSLKGFLVSFCKAPRPLTPQSAQQHYPRPSSSSAAPSLFGQRNSYTLSTSTGFLISRSNNTLANLARIASFSPQNARAAMGVFLRCSDIYEMQIRSTHKSVSCDKRFKEVKHKWDYNKISANTDVTAKSEKKIVSVSCNESIDNSVILADNVPEQQNDKMEGYVIEIWNLESIGYIEIAGRERLPLTLVEFKLTPAIANAPENIIFMDEENGVYLKTEKKAIIKSSGLAKKAIGRKMEGHPLVGVRIGNVLILQTGTTSNSKTLEPRFGKGGVIFGANKAIVNVDGLNDPLDDAIQKLTFSLMICSEKDASNFCRDIDPTEYSCSAENAEKVAKTFNKISEALVEGVTNTDGSSSFVFTAILIGDPYEVLSELQKGLSLRDANLNEVKVTDVVAPNPESSVKLISLKKNK